MPDTMVIAQNTDKYHAVVLEFIYNTLGNKEKR